MKYLLPFLSVVMIGALSCCQQQVQPGSEEPAAQPPAPQYLGTVHQVYPSQNFALLRIIGPIPAPGTTIITHPADGSTQRMGNLVVAEDTPARSGMLVADIRSGAVLSGDRVFLYRDIALPDPNAVRKTPEQENAAPEERTPAPLSVRTSGTARPVSMPAETANPAVSAPIVEPLPAQPAITPPLPPQPTQAPSYLNDIPDDVSQWD